MKESGRALRPYHHRPDLLGCPHTAHHRDVCDRAITHQRLPLRCCVCGGANLLLLSAWVAVADCVHMPLELEVSIGHTNKSTLDQNSTT